MDKTKKGGKPMVDIINKLAEIEAAASHIMEDVSEQKKQLAQQYEEAVQKFDANIDMEIQNRSDTIRQELEIQMKKELENQRNEAEQILTQLEAYYTKCHTNMAKEIYDRILRM